MSNENSRARGRRGRRRRFDGDVAQPEPDSMGKHLHFERKGELST